jgi:hypothetical protein
LRNRKSLKWKVEWPGEAFVNQGKAVCTTV